MISKTDQLQWSTTPFVPIYRDEKFFFCSIFAYMFQFSLEIGIISESHHWVERGGFLGVLIFWDGRGEGTTTKDDHLSKVG